MRVSAVLLLGMLCAGLVATVPAHAQDYSVGQPVLLPPQFYVGDRVEMRVSVRVPPDVTLAIPKKMPTSRWITFHSIRVYPQSDGQEVRIIFTPYHPGTLPFPTIDLGRAVLKDLSIYVQPVLKSPTTVLRPAFSQLLVPNTRLIIGLIIGVLLVVPLVWIGFFRFGRQGVGQLIDRFRENMPYRRLIRNLRALGQNASEMRARDFYIELLAQLRAYLTHRLGLDFNALTTAETEPRLGPLQLTDVELETLVGVFRYGDLVKFAGRSASVRQRRAHVDELMSLISAVARRSSRLADANQIDAQVAERDEAGRGRAGGRRGNRLSSLLRRRGYVATFHRETTPRRKEPKQNVGS